MTNATATYIIHASPNTPGVISGEIGCVDSRYRLFDSVITYITNECIMTAIIHECIMTYAHTAKSAKP